MKTVNFGLALQPSRIQTNKQTTKEKEKEKEKENCFCKHTSSTITKSQLKMYKAFFSIKSQLPKKQVNNLLHTL